MISWDLGLTGPVVKQQFSRPVVYLDHWAVRKISEDPALSAQFAIALKRRKGTWAVSWVNLFEFVSMTDEGQAKQFELLLESVLPHLFFIDFQPFTVMARERDLREGKFRHAPYDDVSLLETFAELLPSTPCAFTANGFVTTSWRSDAK